MSDMHTTLEKEAYSVLFMNKNSPQQNIEQMAYTCAGSLVLRARARSIDLN